MADPNGKGIYFINGRNAGTLVLYRVATKQFSDVVSDDATQPEFSNDGRHFAYITAREGGKNEIWITDVDGNHRLKLVSGNRLETLAWSNDATRFLYAEVDKREMKLYVIDADGKNLHQLPWAVNFVGFAIWEPGNQSIILGGLDKDERTAKNWRISLDGSPATPFFDGCGMATDLSPDKKFIISTVIWGENPGLFQYSIADKKCATSKRASLLIWPCTPRTANLSSIPSPPTDKPPSSVSPCTMEFPPAPRFPRSNSPLPCVKTTAEMLLRFREICRRWSSPGPAGTMICTCYRRSERE
jgi:hypothetical protein